MAKKRSALRVDPAGSSVPREPQAAGGPRRKELSLAEYADGVRGRDRAILGRAITLIESNHPNHQELAQQLLSELLPHTGKSVRVGITGVPGVGKSTFIETLGCSLLKRDHRVAVLAVDPSSGVSGGSILGDKTRMAKLSADERAFIRPTPSAGTLGGVARKSRESLLVCEAAGYDVVLVETVGVGQSETMVADMTDFFLALLLAGAGDELQGIKRGLIELTDMIAINKADGSNEKAALRAATQYESALHYMRAADPDWSVPVLTCSALENRGIDELWERVAGRWKQLRQSQKLDEKRRQQMLRWMWSLVDEQLHASLRGDPSVKTVLERVERDILSGALPPVAGALEILEAFRNK